MGDDYLFRLNHQPATRLKTTTLNPLHLEDVPNGSH